MQDLLEFLGPVRKQLMLALKDRGSATAAELADASFLSIAAARAHLLVLERAGLVSYDPMRKGVGRPTHLYRLTPQGQALFPQCYAALLRLLALRTKSDAEYGEQLWRTLEEVQVAQFGQLFGPASAESRIDRITRVLESKGFAPQVERRRLGEWQIELGHCPLLDLAQEFPELCTVERRVLASVAGEGATVTHTRHRLEGDSHCVASVRFVGIPIASAS